MRAKARPQTDLLLPQRPAVAALRELVESAETPAAIRLRAALAVLSAVGADGPELIGSTDPAEIRGQFSHRDLCRALDSF
jgi:hypothetical protein